MAILGGVDAASSTSNELLCSCSLFYESFVVPVSSLLDHCYLGELGIEPYEEKIGADRWISFAIFLRRRCWSVAAPNPTAACSGSSSTFERPQRGGVLVARL
jgi:hypothetical protein